MTAVKPQTPAPTARERRRAAALAAMECAIATAGPGQLEAIRERLLAFTIAARMAKRLNEEQAARKALALVERRLAELCARARTTSLEARSIGHVLRDDALTRSELKG